MEFGAIVCKPQNPLCTVCNLKKNCKFFKDKTYTFQKKKYFIREKKYNIYCYLNKQKKEIALTKNKNLSFLKNFKIPETQTVMSGKSKKMKGWNYLCNYKNSISNIKMNINLFHKLPNVKPQNFAWYSFDRPTDEFIPSFTKKIFKKVEQLYI